MRAAIYVRVSSTRQEDEGTSLATQEARCRAFATQHGAILEELHVYRETHSGIELWERPQLTALRSAMRQRAVDLVICFAIDRLSRDPVHLGVVLSEAEHHGVAIEFVTEPLDGSPEGQLIRFVRGYAAKVEHLKIQERTVRGRRARVEAGKLLPGGKPIYGYRWRDATKAALDIDDMTAPVVRRIFLEAAGGKGLRQIGAGLTQDGIPTPTGQGTRWQPSTIAHLLHKPAYIGQAFGWGWRKGGVTPQTFDPAKAIALPEGTIPALIEMETWQGVQAILARNKARAIRNAKNPESALLRGGYVRCGYCGHVMRARPTSNGGTEYVCNQSSHYPGSCRRHSIRASILDAAVWRRAMGILTEPETVAREIERLRTEDPTAHDLATVDRAITGIERQRSNLARAVALLDDEDAAAPLIAELAGLRDRKWQLSAERENMLRRQESWAKNQADLDGLEQWCHTVAKNAANLNYHDKRMALDALGFGVTLYRADHEPRYVITADINPTLVSNTT